MAAPGDIADQRALDAQFTLDSVRDLDALFARRAAANRAASERYEHIRDLRYGQDAAEKLTIFPARSANPPAQIFIHGGFWSSLSAADFHFLADGFIPYQSALIVIDYPLIPAVRMADIVRSCRRAIAWIFRNCARYGINANRLHVSGNSAGGHLVAEVMNRGWMRDAGVPPDVIQGGCAISGLYDLASVAASFRNETLKLTPEEVAAFSPLRHPINIDAPMIVTVGGDETPEFVRQSADYAAACRAAGVKVEHIVPEGANHIDIVLDHFGNPASALNIAARRQMYLPL